MAKVLNMRTYSFLDLTSVPVNVMRPSKWGNPYVIGKDGTRGEVVAQYREYIMKRPALVAAAKRDLRGKDLVCCCAPLACHADILLEVANS